MTYNMAYDPDPSGYTVRAVVGYCGGAWLLIRNRDSRIITQSMDPGGCLYQRQRLLVSENADEASR